MHRKPYNWHHRSTKGNETTTSNYICNKIDKEGLNKILEGYSLPRISQEEIENMNRADTSTEIEYMIKSVQITEIQDQMSSQVNSKSNI